MLLKSSINIVAENVLMTFAEIRWPSYPTTFLHQYTFLFEKFYSQMSNFQLSRSLDFCNLSTYTNVATMFFRYIKTTTVQFKVVLYLQIA